jgi:hypothetical protein
VCETPRAHEKGDNTASRPHLEEFVTLPCLDKISQEGRFERESLAGSFLDDADPASVERIQGFVGARNDDRYKPA